MHSHMGLESLIQRGKSPFYKDLVSVLENVQTAVLGLPNASDSDVYQTWQKHKFSDAIQRIIRQHTDIPFAGVGLTKNPEPMLYCAVRKNDAVAKGRHDRTKTPGMMMEEIHRVYDDRKGVVKESIDPNQSLYQFGIFFNTGLWTFRNPDGSLYFTPSELAAGTLHEIGHSDHWIRAGYRVQDRLIDASDIIDYITSTPDRAVIKEIIQSLKTSPYLEKNWRNVLKVVETYFDTSNALDDPQYYEALNSLILVVSAETSNKSLQSFSSKTNNVKTRVSTNLFDLDSERTADEYASRNGAYADFSAFLLKLENLVGPRYKDIYSHITGSKLSIVSNTLRQFRDTFGWDADQVAHGYDPFFRRMELIIETAKHAFHDNHLSPEITAEIKEQILQSEAYLKDYKSTQRNKIRSLIRDWKDNVTKLGRIVASPVQNRMSKDYERLQNANRSLTRNPLYYLAKR